jgi:cytochrome c peroxidase
MKTGIARFTTVAALAASGGHCAGSSHASATDVAADGAARPPSDSPTSDDDASADAGGDAGAVPIDPSVLTLLEMLSPPTLPAPPADDTDRFADDPAAAHLGQELFFDPAFSGALLDPDNDGTAHTLGSAGQTGRVACAGCHLPAAAFSDSRSLGGGISLASGWGLRKAPSLLDVGQDKLLMWDGRRDALYNQVFGPIESPLEMNSSRLYAVEVLASKYRTEYEAIFGPMPAFDDPQSFPQLAASATGCQQGGVLTPTCTGTMHGMPGDDAEYSGLSPTDQQAVTLAVVNIGKAVGAYERRLTCGQGRFDRWMRGDASALSASEERGAVVFVTTGQCVRCHSGPYLSDQTFHNVGLTPAQVNFSPPDDGDHGAATGIAAALADPLSTQGSFSDGDDGRLPTTIPPTFEGAFKTPMLRCVGGRPAFMHTGQLHTLNEVVAFFNRGGDRPEFGTSEIKALGLSTEDQSALASFLHALDGPGPDTSLLQAP